MRVIRTEIALGAKNINEIKIMKSRHELSFVMPALIYIIEERSDLLKLVQKDLTLGKSEKKGREGMPAYMTLCLYVIRHTIAANYAELEWMLYNDITIRQILGDSEFNPLKVYDEKTIHQNIKKLKEKTINAIDNAVIACAKKCGFERGGNLRGDSFVCKSNIHYPSESSILFDCGRVLINESRKISETIIGRQHKHLLKEIKSVSRRIGKLRKSKKNKEKEIEKQHIELIGRLENIIQKITKKEKINKVIIQARKNASEVFLKKYSVVAMAVVIAEKMIRLTKRRVLLNEEIPNREKLLSIFEQDVELINRGKFPVAIEFGHKIFLNQSESGFIVDWDIMKPGATDAEMIEPSIQKIKKNHSLTFKCCSYDKGFHTPENQKRLPKIFQTVVIPKKGKCNKEETEREHSRKFIRLRLWRAGIESLISSLVRGNGMGLCPDRGLANYRKYIAGCVLARNLQKFGEYLIAEQEKKDKKMSKNA